MNKKKHNRKLKNLITICALFAIILSVGTYAWFIGMKTVRVTPFEIEIATTEGLFLSMDGNEWYYNLNPNEAHQYDGNTNLWAEKGLIPISTVGEPDTKSSRLKLYEKGSLTATGGGYRLLTSRVDNYTETASGSNVFSNGEGYVAFDLFIKNLSGEKYYDDNEPKNEEAIYLNIDSAVGVGSMGVDGTGIENSVRVAFMQVGRVIADTTDVSTITGITCKTSGAVTGICREAQIWEPNDKQHVQNAINWFNTSCKTRKEDGTDVNLKSSYNSAACTGVTATSQNTTYAVNKVIDIDDNVDVYDGLNGYTANTTDNTTYSAASDKSGFKLVGIDTFTDTEKGLTGMDRPEFMTLAPNSITKVRVYVYIEGQDVDNYDFAQLGGQVNIKFGFTKERFTEDDVTHGGPSIDITPTTEDVVHTTGA